MPDNTPNINSAGEIEVVAFGYLVFQTLRSSYGDIWTRVKWATQDFTAWKQVAFVS